MIDQCLKNPLHSSFSRVRLYMVFLFLLYPCCGPVHAHQWKTYTTADGLVENTGFSVYQSSDGAMWFGTFLGVSRYDGTWQTYTQSDGLARNAVHSVYQSLDGAMWFGTGGGVSRYDGTSWQTYTTADGLANNIVYSVYQSFDGAMWFGTLGGVSRYDGISWQTYTEDEGLAHFAVRSIYQSLDGAMWFGTEDGVSRYDGTWQTYTGDDGLAFRVVNSVYRSLDGAMWFGTHGGVSRYDGTWQTYTQGDGLVSNSVYPVYQSSDEAMWFGTWGGVSRFQRPSVATVQTVILHRPPHVLGVNRLFFECRGYDMLSDLPPPLSYALTQAGVPPQDGDWSMFSYINGFELTEADLTNGTWTFSVRAKDRHGNIDPTPATHTFTVDLVASTVAIFTPRRGDAVSGEVAIAGSAFDGSSTPDLEEFVLEYGRGEEPDEIREWAQIGTPQSAPVKSSTLAVWNTEDLPDGNYVLRIRAIDKLGHLSEDAVNVEVFSALQEISQGEGGHVASAKGSVNLMIPPNGLEANELVQIAFVPMPEQITPPTGIVATGIVYRVGPADLEFRKRSTLTIGYEPADIVGMNENDLAIFMLSGGAWVRLGGTVDVVVHKVSVAIDSPGTFALFEAAWAGGIAGVSDINCQPRIISPGGSLYPSGTDISFDLGASGPVHVRIYSIAGNLMREVVQDRVLNAGLNTVQWDGRDENGKVVTDGIYIVAIQAGGKTANKTVAVLNR